MSPTLRRNEPMVMKRIWMLTTAPGGKGGIATVIRQYQEAGLFANGAVRLLETHHDHGILGLLLPFLSACMALWSALLFGRVSLVHAHASHRGSFWRKFILVWPALVFGVPVLVHLHGSDFQEFYAGGSAWRRLCIRSLFRRAFRVIALSSEWQRWVLQVQPSARTEVLFNSLSGPADGAQCAPLGETPIALFLGRIGDRKGSFDLLRAFALVQRELPQARLIFGGDGEVEKLLAEVKVLGLESAVSYAGWVGAEQKERLFRDAWVFALPSYHEGLPMAILEAMARGRSVVSCPVGGIAEAVEDGKTGGLVAPGDAAALAEALKRVLSDREWATAQGAAGRALFVTKFSNEANLPRLIAIYRQAGVAMEPQLDMTRAAS